MRSRLLPVLFVAGLLGPAAAGRAEGFDERTLRELSAALACVNLSLDDLGWDKRPLDDPFRLAVVDETLDRPLALAERAERAERDFGAGPTEAAAAAAEWLQAAGSGPRLEDLPGSEAVPADPRERQFRRAAPDELVRLVDGLRRARALVAAAGLRCDGELLRRDAPRFYLDESEESWDGKPALATIERFVVADAVAAFRVLAELAEESRGQEPPEARRTRTWTLGDLTVSLGGEGDDVHSADVVLDVGGNDTYEGCRVVVDVAGDDTYRDAGSGLFDAGLVVDLAGDDRYLGTNVAQGAAVGGAALLVDHEGDDRYEADQVSQGAGVLGVGMLFDLAGNDSYRGARFVQGFGGLLGLGVLSDRAGADTYWASGKYPHAPLLPDNWQSLSQGFGFGLRPDASGGVGVLVDSAGNDSYFAEVFGQGASYWYALGLLVDSAGHDKYDLFQYGQGAGIHLSPAALMDRSGQDAYSCNNGVAQGSGHDWGVGLLWDRGGEDYYQGAGMSQGGANANGFGFLVDEGGNDGYSGTRSGNQGGSFFARGTFGLGVLLDLGGKDRYTEGGEDGATWTRMTVGVGRDVAEPKDEEARP